jgi:hypothetical protein
MTQANSQDHVLMVELMRVSGLLGSYVVTALSEERLEPSADDERALADQVASVADGLRTRADRRAAARVGRSNSCHQQEGHPHRSSTGAGKRQPRTSDEEAVRRWPFLARLVELPGPQWQFGEERNGAVVCSRTCGGSYTETVCIIGVEHARLTRSPIPRGPRRSAAHIDFVGPLGAIIEVLQEPVRWVTEP